MVINRPVAVCGTAGRVWASAAVLMVALAGCSSQSPGNGSPARTVAEAPSPAGTGQPEDGAVGLDFTAGLLPAAQFGADAVAEPLSAADEATSDPRRLPEGTVSSNPECEASPEPPRGDPDGYAGQSVLAGRSLFIQTVQSPFEGTPQDPRTYADGFGECQTGTVTLPNGTVMATVFSALQIGELGDLNGGRRMDSKAVTPDGLTYTSTNLFADVVDGDRVVSLGMVSLVPNEPVDVVGFRQLVAAAYQHQHDVLG